MTKKMESFGRQTKAYNPSPWQWCQSHIKRPWLNHIIFSWITINSRNHRKCCIIDDDKVFIGSMNIDKCHISKEKGGDNWKDISILLENQNIKSLKDAFERAWGSEKRTKFVRPIIKQRIDQTFFRLLDKKNQRKEQRKKLINRINKSKEKLWITTGYFIPDYELLKSIIAAAKRGVDVKIILSSTSDIVMSLSVRAARVFIKS